MIDFLEYFHPAHLLFPALLGSSMMSVAFPLIGAQLILRRAVFLGLTLPQIAAAGVACAFWLQQTGILPTLGGDEHRLAMIGSLIFTLLGMGISASLEPRSGGSTELRLAAAYLLASALTILFIVVNPAGELAILSMLKGEVIALTQSEIEILAVVFGVVLASLILFRREFLLTSFDPDLAFLLKGSNLIWSMLLYVLAGIGIAVGVIMAGPLLVFGFLVLPPLAARPWVGGMTSFLWLSSLLGLLMAILGFYFSVALDLPLGPTDVALGCLLVFASHGLGKIRLRAAAVSLLIVTLPFMLAGCAGGPPADPLIGAPGIHQGTVWIAKVRNSTPSSLRLPASNPLRSLGEIAGRLSPESRETVMDLLRQALQSELRQRGVQASFPELKDPRLANFSMHGTAAATAREGQLSGLILLTEIRRWNSEPRKLSSVAVEFKLIQIADGSTVWQRRIQRAVSTAAASHEGEAHMDAIKAIVRELFAG